MNDALAPQIPSWFLPPPIDPPPSGEDLPSEDGIPMETNLHRLLMMLLIEILEFLWAGRKDFFVGGNMFLYYSVLQARKNDFRGPDFFVVLDTEKRQRKSWVVWEEDGKAPDFVLEITSPSTAAVDRGDKKRIYGKALRVPEYFIYDPLTQKLEGYRLDAGGEYQPIEPDAQGRLASKRLGLSLGPLAGTWHGFTETWLRFYTPDGKLVPTEGESLSQRLLEYEKRFGPLPSSGPK